jgi:hypothetical protein
MPQKTNLDINPYYDDFDADNNFYRVLFKPGFPIQARELTTLQSILQNQIESFGSHIFKEGSMVIPGGISYDNSYTSVKVNPQFLNIDISIYAKELIGKRVIGSSSGVSATILKIIFPPELGIEYPTFFVKYIKSNNSFEFAQFSDSENLILEDQVVYGNTTLNPGDAVSQTINVNSTAIGSAANVASGVYFIRGNFVNVDRETLVLDPYSNIPSYRVGFNIFEEIISSNEDASLYDNAKGFSNYAAPGADRLKISLSLGKKLLSDFDDKNFFEILRVDNGEIKKLQDKSVYSLIKDYFAKRTFEESGDYSVGDFKLEVVESLNDGISNEGIYKNTQKTQQLNDPSEDLSCVRISSGKAYVRGYDIDTIGTTIIDVEKPRDTREVPASLVPFELGNLLRANNVSGTPFIGINNANNVVSLRNERKNSTQNASGIEIGKARVYSFGLTDALYENESTEWDLYLFDIQTYTVLHLNKELNSTSCPSSSFIRGLSSGATGYVVSAPVNNQITLTQTSGSFSSGERILINESNVFNRSITRIVSHDTSDIKSVFQDYTTVSGITTDFVADTVLRESSPTGFKLTDKITINPSLGIATCPGKVFTGIRSDTIIVYQKDGENLQTFNRVVNVSSDARTLFISGINTVPNVNEGSLPLNTTSFTFNIASPSIRNIESARLYAPLTSKNVSFVNLNNSNLTISKQISNLNTGIQGEIILNSGSLDVIDVFFEQYDAERYSIFYSDGTIENLTSDQVSLNSDGSQIVIKGLKTQETNVVATVTLRKRTVINKSKQFVRSQQLEVVSTNTGITTITTGLSTSNFYGLRVEDREISLNVPDVVNVIAVYESLDTSKPTLDNLTFVSGLSLNTITVIGEKIIGSSSGAIVQLVSAPSENTINFVYLNSNKLIVGESVLFEESSIRTNIINITSGQYLNISDRYVLDKGQKEEYYDYSKIVRRTQASAPSKKLLIIYDYYEVPQNDRGDLYTVNSYDNERFKKDIPTVGNAIRLSDTLDFRPRVSRFTSNNTSPFSYSSRIFSSSVGNSTLLITPGESSFIGYNYYLPRIDKVCLDKLGNFSVIKGVSADSPKEPLNNEEAMTIGIINFPAYLYDVENVSISQIDNRRYTMRDIGKLEDRIENLEITTSLSLLELNTKSLQIQDADGLSRFKTGFFVDDFKDNRRIDLANPDSKCDVDVQNQILNTPIDFTSFQPQLALEPSIDVNIADFTSNINLLDSNVQKTGDLITLKYGEVGWLEQPLASRVENVNPFAITEFVGLIQLTPQSDNWVRNVYVPGGERRITGGFDGSYIENILISSEPDTHMRSRNVQFASGGLRPITRFYTFIDGIEGIDIIPKLIEIGMISGAFSVGEIVEGYDVDGNIQVRFRVARQNHKLGPYDNPTRTFNSNPYNIQQSLDGDYSPSSTVLNIDTASMAAEAIGDFYGYITVGTTLVGQVSGAQAQVSNIRLISDTFGDLGGLFFIRDPLTSPPPPVRVQTGDKEFKLTSSSNNTTPLPGSVIISSAEATYSATGIVDTFRQDTVVVRRPPPRRRGKDPLAQSFTVDETGAFLTSVDVYFANKDENEKLTAEIRTVELGTPTNILVQDFAQVVLDPSEIIVSSDASVPTNIKFPSPIYLQPRTEYALVLLAPSSINYEVWIARMGENTVNAQQLPDVEAVVVTKQYLGGSLFKSQNGTIWTADQFEDMKFKLYKAKFTATSGTVYYYNPKLSIISSNTPKLLPNPIRTYPRKIIVGIQTTTILGNVLTPGTKVSGTGSRTTGVIERTGGPIVASGISTISVGAGYSFGSYTNVEFYSIIGNGEGARGTVSIDIDGTVGTIFVALSGNGYSEGDIIGIKTESVQVGSGSRFSVNQISEIDRLYLTSVQGDEFFVDGDSKKLVYYNGNTPLPSSAGFALTAITSSTPVGGLYSGNIIEVEQYNHGMSADNNIIKLSNIEPNTIPSTLNFDLNVNDSVISVADTTKFAKFEGITTSSGYVKVNNEIIYYNSISSGVIPAGTLGIGTRGIDSTFVRQHPVNSKVYPYELSGFSLTKINNAHDMPFEESLTNIRDIDVYHLEVDRGSRSSGDDQLNFREETQCGGNNAKATRNIQFNNVTPQFNTITPGQNTTVSAQMRTVSATSVGGNESSFIDQGFESVELNQTNFLTTTRMVCSDVNEIERLPDLPKNKSFTLGITLNSTDENLSPVLDIENGFVSFGRNRLNNPIGDYVNDSRVNSISGDPHSAIYISNKVLLKQPATSLKVLVSCYRHSSADFRVLYKLDKLDSGEINQSYILFPGYDNLIDTDGDGFGDFVVSSRDNSGKSDAFVRSSQDGEFLEYQFTEDNLEQFNGYQIKIVMNGTNEARSPQFKDIRAIALA